MGQFKVSACMIFELAIEFQVEESSERNRGVFDEQLLRPVRH
jgi:hypothetical protein